MTDNANKKPDTPRQRPLRRRIFWCCVWCVCIIAFLIWIKCLWGVIVLPFIFDIYISKKVNWNWWRQLKSSRARVIMSWVDAIVFALVAAYFVNLYFFQNFVIPSSSLEKSLLTGDYLFVSKMSYGPRKPITPLSIPMVANNLPITGTKSYLEWPRWKYERVRGFGNVKLNDIVVFNYPSGDTVATARLLLLQLTRWLAVSGVTMGDSVMVSCSPRKKAFFSFIKASSTFFSSSKSVYA